MVSQSVKFDNHYLPINKLHLQIDVYTLTEYLKMPSYYTPVLRAHTNLRKIRSVQNVLTKIQ